jgi:hypothetical protein
MPVLNFNYDQYVIGELKPNEGNIVSCGVDENMKLEYYGDGFYKYLF